jgi:hypothetical protein
MSGDKKLARAKRDLDNAMSVLRAASARPVTPALRRRVVAAVHMIDRVEHRLKIMRRTAGIP